MAENTVTKQSVEAQIEATKNVRKSHYDSRVAINDKIEQLKGFNIPDDHALIVEQREALADVDNKIADIEQKLATLEARARTAQYAAPLKRSFGKIKVDTTDLKIGTVGLADLETTISEAQNRLVVAQSQVKALSRLSEAVSKANIPAEALADMQPVKFTATDDNQVEIEFSSGRGGGGGTRGPIGTFFARGMSPDAEYAPSVPFENVKIRGEGADYATGTAFLEAHFSKADLDKASGRDKNPNRSISWRTVAETLGVDFDRLSDDTSDADASDENDDENVEEATA